MQTFNTIPTILNTKSEVINRIAVISFDEAGAILEPITSYSDVVTIAIKYGVTQTYNAHHTIVPSVDPESQRGFDGPPDFYLISNPENATSEILQLENALMGVDMVIILVELGRYTVFNATFTLPVFIKYIRMQCSKIVCVAKEPFYFEGVRRRHHGEKCLAKLLEENIPTVVLDVNKFLFVMPHEIGWRDAIAVINSIASTTTCDLIRHLRKTGGWEALSKIIQGSCDSKIYFDITKRAMKPEAQFIYTIFGRCNTPVLIESMPIAINIPAIKPITKTTTKSSSWIMSLFKGGKSNKSE